MEITPRGRSAHLAAPQGHISDCQLVNLEGAGRQLKAVGHSCGEHLAGGLPLPRRFSWACGSTVLAFASMPWYSRVIPAQ